MPFLVVVAVAYTSYVHAQDYKYDARIKLEEMESVALLPMELKLAVHEAPISTISFYNGNHKQAYELLKARQLEMIDKNPWLAGYLVRRKQDGVLKIWYDPKNGAAQPPNNNIMIEMFHDIELSRETTPYTEYGKALKGHANVKVLPTKQLIGNMLPFWKVSIIPDADFPDTRFCLVQSLAHVVGDGHTFFQLSNMLLNTDSPILALSPERKLQYTDAVTDLLGKREANILQNVTSNPRWEILQRRRRKRNPMQIRIFSVSQEWLDQQKLIYGVSLNSILTSWWFNVTACSFGFMALNMRRRVGDILDDYDVGNYNHAIPYLPCDYITPDLMDASLRTFRRGSFNQESLPKHFPWDATFAVVSNWASFGSSSDNSNINPDIQQHLSMPFLEYESHVKRIPSKLSAMIIFGLPSGRMGVFCIAPQDIMTSQVDNSPAMDKLLHSVDG